MSRKLIRRVADMAELQRKVESLSKEKEELEKRIEELEDKLDSSNILLDSARTGCKTRDERLVELEGRAAKWDALKKKMDAFYDENSECDLVEIGEAAASAFGYL